MIYICGAGAHTKRMKKVYFAAALCLAAALFAGCVHFEAQSKDNHIPQDLQNFSSCKCESAEGTYEVQKKDSNYLIVSAGEIWLLSPDGGVKYAEGEITRLSGEDARAATLFALNSAGLIYAFADKQTYIMTDTSGKYRAEAEEFFKSAEYERYKLEKGGTDNFEQYFAGAAPQLFGDFDDYEITLDCSQQGAMTLTLENLRFATAEKYVFSYLDKTSVSLPDAIREEALQLGFGA